MYAKVVGPKVADITSQAVGGTGVFDVMMSTLSAHIKSEYQANRITGAEYAKSYVALTQLAMGSAVQFVLAKEQAYWAAQQAQIATVSARVALETARVALNKIQFDTMVAQYNLSQILPQQRLLFIQQTATAKEQAEVQRAQTMDTRSDGVTSVTGLISRQRNLYEQQITSYQRDSELKVGKLFADSWTIQKTVDEGLVAPNNFTNAEIDEVLSALRANNNLGAV